MGEKWSDIPEWEGLYQVSDQGRVRSLDREVTNRLGVRRRYKGKILKQKRHARGYGHRLVHLHRPGASKWESVHRLVLFAFVGEPEDGQEARHLDGDASNNNLSNLAWGSRNENREDRMIHEGNLSKDHCNRGHLLAPWNIVASYKKKGHRKCLSCDRASSKKSIYARRYGIEVDMQRESDVRFEKLLKENGSIPSTV